MCVSVPSQPITSCCRLLLYFIFVWSSLFCTSIWSLGFSLELFNICHSDGLLKPTMRDGYNSFLKTVRWSIYEHVSFGPFWIVVSFAFTQHLHFYTNIRSQNIANLTSNINFIFIWLLNPLKKQVTPPLSHIYCRSDKLQSILLLYIFLFRLIIWNKLNETLYKRR